MYHSIQESIQQLNACEESPLKVRERCVSRNAEKNFGIKSNVLSKVKWAAITRESQTSGRLKKENLAEAPQSLKNEKRQRKLSSQGKARAGGLQGGWRWERESGGARRRRRRVCE
eukprot:848163-Pleurochrysis_carterae.AAC.1